MYLDVTGILSNSTFNGIGPYKHFFSPIGIQSTRLHSLFSHLYFEKVTEKMLAMQFRLKHAFSSYHIMTRVTPRKNF